MGKFAKIDSRPKTSLAHKEGFTHAGQPSGRSLGTGHKKSATLANHGGSAHRVGGGKNPIQGGKGIFGK